MIVLDNVIGRNILADFSFLFDTDYAVIKYLLNLYHHSKYFIQYAHEWTDYYTRCLLVTRDDINPISILLKDEYKDQAYSLYKEILDEHWDEVLNITPLTKVANVLKLACKDTGYFVTVNCRNVKEQVFVESKVKGWSVDIECSDCRRFGILYVYDCKKSFSSIKNINGKSIYVLYIKPNYYNFKKHILNESVMLLPPTNVVSDISAYSDLQLPDGITINDVEVKLNGKQYVIKS